MTDIGAAFAMQAALVQIDASLGRVRTLLGMAYPNLAEWKWGNDRLPPGVVARTIEVWEAQNQTIKITRDFHDMVEAELHSRMLIGLLLEVK